MMFKSSIAFATALFLSSICAAQGAESDPIDALTAKADEIDRLAREIEAEDPSFYGRFGDWTIRRDSNKGCAASNTTDDLNHVSLRYYPLTNLATLEFSNRIATSISVGSVVVLNLYLQSDEGLLDLTWRNTKFKTRSGYGSMILFSADFPASKLLANISSSELAGIFVNDTGKLLTRFTLSNSVDMIELLRACSFEVSELNPNDPFLN